MKRSKLISVAVTVTAAALLPVASATPAAADTSSCTHHWAGPQICIRLEGRNAYNAVTAIWTNPSRGTRHRVVTMSVNGRRIGTKVARRVGSTLSAHWPTTDTGTDTKICVTFRGIGRTACETTRYIGDRTQL
ncbi:hypothetical protein SAMN05428942_7293 [Streptomyces sp. 2112.2]|uniref:hypothetical protein n=1 Tax=Streptomyces sp. 2112.2 TaxID=1881024 RepID=UPI00089BAC81|nr:hypothetical protein [Streptomyces sp. 2112.2]SEF16545.1 hypothetical protein SAMN05428942_7293 [Streptomyces sp. 2112.2]